MNEVKKKERERKRSGKCDVYRVDSDKLKSKKNLNEESSTNNAKTIT